MSLAEIVLYPLACALVFVIGYSLAMGYFVKWPLFVAALAIFVGWNTENEALSVYVFVGTMFALRALASLGNAALARAAR